MEILYFDDIPSTSILASEQLKLGRSVPFAVIAGQQSGGRGRRGRAWSSPTGGIYLSVVLPAPSVETPLLGNIPLWVGVQTAHWIQKSFNTRISLKWPNDLMYDGRKLGGILVESGIEGGKQGPVIVGVGINCNLSRDGVQQTETPPIFLSELCHELLDPQHLASGLAEFLCEHWPALSLPSVGEDFLEWCPPGLRVWIAQDSDWKKDKGTFFLGESIAVDGALVLHSIETPKLKTELHSADHQFFCNSRSQSLPAFIADVGNTAVKIQVSESLWSERVLLKETIFYDDKQSSMQETLTRLRKLAHCRGWPFWIAGVAPARIAELSLLATQAGFLPQMIEKKPMRRFPDSADSYPLDQLGIDRLALIEGWLSTCTDPKKIAVIASFGTALTVDVVAGDGRHLGGVIAPGLFLGAKSLHQHTGLLPLVGADGFNQVLDPVRCVGHSTVSAIAAGLTGAAAGLIERILNDVKKRNTIAPCDIILVLTGGDCDIAADLFPEAAIVPDLIFLGLKSLVGGGRLASSPQRCKE